MTRVFVSYRRNDTTPDLAGRLGDGLRAEFGEENVFLDVDAIDPGDQFLTVINDRLAECHAIVVMIGTEWEIDRLHDPGDVVRHELLAAHELELFILPVLVGTAQMPRTADLPSELRFVSSYQAAKLRRGADFRRDARRIITTLKGTGPQPLSRPVPSKLVYGAVAALALAAAAWGLWELTRNATETGSVSTPEATVLHTAIPVPEPDATDEPIPTTAPEPESTTALEPTANPNSLLPGLPFGLEPPLSVAPPTQDQGRLPIVDPVPLPTLEPPTQLPDGVMSAAHNDLIWSADWSVLNLLATGGQDNIVRIWDTTGTQLAEREFDSEAMEVVWSPDGSRLAVADENQIGIWDLRDGSYRVFADSVRQLSLDWSEDGARLASGSYNRAHVWDVESASRIFDAQLEMGNIWVDLSPDGHHLAAVTSAGPVLEWDITSFELPRLVGQHPGKNASGYVEYMADGTIISGGQDLTLKFFTPGSTDPSNTIVDTWHIGEGQLFADESQVLVIGQVGTARLHNIATGEVAQTFAEFTPPLSDIVLAPDDSQALLVTHGGVAQIWDLTAEPPVPLVELFAAAS